MDYEEEHVEELLHRLPDESARAELVKAFTPLARHLVNRYRGRGQEHTDLMQVAYIGLLNAIDRFDPARGTGFTSFAVPTISGELKRHFRDRSWGMGVPRPIKDLNLTVRQVTDELTQRLGRSPSLVEVAEHLGVSEEEAFQAAALDNAYRPDPLHTAPGEGRCAADTLGSVDEELELIENLDALRPALERLPDREREILALIFYGELTQREVAERLGISQMHVSRLLARSLDRLQTLILV